MIRSLHSQEIDLAKWDDCVQQSEASLLYGFSWYWNAVAPHWRAWVVNDYDAVFPIAEQGIWRFKRCYQPWFLQQTGLFCKRSVSTKETEIIHSHLRKYYFGGYYAISSVSTNHNTAEYSEKRNHVLQIKNSYTEIYNNYRRNTKRNLHHALQANLHIGINRDIDTFIAFLKTHLSAVIPNRKLPYIKNIAVALLQHSSGTVYEVRNRQQQIVAMALFGWSASRLHFLVCASSPEGQQHNAMTLLVDNVLQQSAGQFSLFDFCGSMLPGVAYFNSGFGASIEKYYVLSF